VFTTILDDVYAVLNGKGVVVYRVMVSVMCVLFMQIIQSCIIYFLFEFTFRVRRALVRIISRGSAENYGSWIGLLFKNIRHVVSMVGMTPVTPQKSVQPNAV
jgi:hypothetical protein